jgi:hypothetical protein
MFQSIQPKKSTVRALPYPFRGALSISNDAEFLKFHFFEALMKFLNTQKTTPFGVGLGLEVTSSLFFYSANPNTFSYFYGADVHAKVSPVAKRLKDYLRSGWIDTNHAYGDFNKVDGFRREHALRCYEVLTKLNLRIKVFTNHGSAENVQNVGADAAYHCGDLKDHYAYHADLMKRNGVRYVWTDSMFTQRELSLKRRSKYLIQKGPILKDCVLQDGSSFRGFLRFRSTGANAPNLSSFAYQIQQIDWKKFYKSRGMIVLYQHLGILSRSAGVCHQATVDAVSSRPQVFLAPFYILEREFKEGRLWVCGLSRLLNYIDVVESVDVQYDTVQNRYNIMYDEAVEHPEIFFQGLTLYIDPAQLTRVYHNGYELSIVYNGPDETGRYSVSVPIQPMENIW